MLKRSLVLGVLAAMTLAPAAFAGQTQGNSTVTTIEAGSVGNGNRTNINYRTNVNQSHSNYEASRVILHTRMCAAGSQTQGNVTDTAINTGVVGNRNNTRINNVTNVRQAQSAACY